MDIKKVSDEMDVNFLYGTSELPNEITPGNLYFKINENNLGLIYLDSVLKDGTGLRIKFQQEESISSDNVVNIVGGAQLSINNIEGFPNIVIDDSDLVPTDTPCLDINASDILFDNTISNTVANNVQKAIDDIYSILGYANELLDTILGE